MNVLPCDDHRSILSPSLPWHRAVEVAEDCPNCVVSDELSKKEGLG